MRTGDLEKMNAAVMRRTTVADLPQSAGLPAVLVTCLDARTDPAHLFGIGPGAAAVIRNVGGRVTDEVITQLGALAGLGTTLIGPDVRLDVGVIHHTMCGAMMLADTGIRAQVADSGRVDGDAIAALGITDPVETVRADVAKLVASGLPDGITVSGYVYDTAAGTIRQVVDNHTLGT